MVRWLRLRYAEARCICIGLRLGMSPEWKRMNTFERRAEMRRRVAHLVEEDW